ncbi:MAG TPA: uroporphyrinogen-III C-methyltransferase [Legionellaceae bacterium]|nr:uroporphyrinogen-III C-methyltransferase [Legionellaceae bacterium]
MEQDEMPSNFSQQPHSPALPSKRSMMLWLLLIISLLAFTMSIWVFVQYQAHRPILPQTDNDITNSLKSTIQTIQSNLNQMAQTNHDLSQQVYTTQKTLQDFIHEQSRSTHDWQIKKARYYLELAQITADWTDDIPRIIALLKHADFILAGLSYLPVQNTRHAIAQDLLHLEQMPTIDRPGIFNQLQVVQQQIDTLTYMPAPKNTEAVTTSSAPNTWQAYLRSSLQQLQSLIVIHHQDEALIAQLSPQFFLFLRETIHLNVQEAQIGLLEQRPLLYGAGLSAAIKNLNFVFHPTDPKGRAIIQTLTALQTLNVAPVKPLLSPYEKLLDHDFPISGEAHS